MIKTKNTYFKYITIFDHKALYEFIKSNCKINKDCWEYFRCRDNKNYGIKYLNGKSHLVHRLMWEVKYGPTKLQVCHKCDNPPCCNPDHLFIGTQRDNFEDMVKKGRNKSFQPGWKQKVGSKNPNAKLTELQAEDIFSLHFAGKTDKEIAQKLNINRQTINNLTKRNYWKHIKERLIRLKNQ